MGGRIEREREAESSDGVLLRMDSRYFFHHCFSAACRSARVICIGEGIGWPVACLGGIAPGACAVSSRSYRAITPRLDFRAADGAVGASQLVKSASGVPGIKVPSHTPRDPKQRPGDTPYLRGNELFVRLPLRNGLSTVQPCSERR
jgi:hypothetical protein